MIIEIAGAIASGKSTITRALEENGWSAVFEIFQNNPFLDDFYSAPNNFAFETELCFLLQHYNIIKKTLSAENICYDFSLVQDLAYADINLSGVRHSLFYNVYNEVRSEIGYPDILIHLSCDENILLQRIRNRGRLSEKDISNKYLTSLNSAISIRVNEIIKYTKVINIDSSKHDFRFLPPIFFNKLLFTSYN